jgi:hypothetical protein
VGYLIMLHTFINYVTLNDIGVSSQRLVTRDLEGTGRNLLEGTIVGCLCECLFNTVFRYNFAGPISW